MSAKGILIISVVLLSGLSIAWYRIHQHRLIKALCGDTGLESSYEEDIPPAFVVANAYMAEVASNPPDPLMLEDVVALPYPKELIRLSLQAVLKGPLSDERREALEVSYMTLADYQPGVDSVSMKTDSSVFREHIGAQSEEGFINPKEADAPELTAEVTEQHDHYSGIYQLWEQDREQFAADLRELGIRQGFSARGLR